jgi:hypothetical protein
MSEEMNKHWHIALLIAISIALASIPMTIIGSGQPDPGLYLEFKLFKPVEDKYVEETNILRTLGNVTLCIYMDIVAPEHAVPLASGCYNGIPLIHVPYEVIKPYIEKWFSTLRDWSIPVRIIQKHEIGLIIRAFVVNNTSGEVIYNIHDSIPLTLGDFIEAKAIYYALAARSGVYQVARGKTIIETGRLKYYVNIASDKPTPTPTTVEYELKFRVTPENMTSYLPSNYFKNVNGVLYVKTPVMIIYNQYPFSGYVMGSIIIAKQDAKVELRLGFNTAAPIESKVRNGEIPSLTLNVGGTTFGGQTYYFGEIIGVPPEEVGWIFIWGRPILDYYRVWHCYQGGEFCYYGEEMRTYISSVYIVGNTIQGGWEGGWPHSYIMNSFFNGTNLTQLFIPDTPLSDEDLDVNESITIEQITQYCDSCGGGFEIGVPVGSMGAIALCSAFGYGLATSACIALTAVTGAFQVSLGFEGASIRISGVLENKGRYNGIGYNIYENVTMAISRYQYYEPPPWWCPWCSGCYYNVPAGIYFRTD